ncbi:tyrosine-type recombinase/integrase [Pantoea sp. T14]|uniref:tyrosine-type recombinase/integrase n=1 Tax=Pantoea sp. T14 TaxID=3085685 RepID=UPI002FCB2858
MATTKVLEKEEALQVVSWMYENGKELYGDVCTVMAALVLRVGDTVGLRMQDIKRGEVLKVTEQKTGKVKEVEHIPEIVLQIVEKRRAMYPNDSFLFTAHSNRASGMKGVSREEVTRNIKAAALACDITGTVGSHSLRKFGASECYNATGKDLGMAMKVLNHSNIQTTMKYLRLDQKRIDSALNSVWG